MTGWSALYGALGGVALVFALLSVVLLFFGAPPEPSWLWGNIVIGVILLGSALFSNLDSLRERMHSGETQRVGRYGTSAVVSTFLALVIVGFIAFLTTRHGARFDWSEAGVHSLSDQTQKVLRGLDADVEVVAFYSPLQSAPIRDLLDRYTHESDHFRVEYVDPVARPDRVQQLGIGREDLSQGVLRVAIGDESVDLVEVDEERLTNALVKLTRGGEKIVYFLYGHLERPATGEGADDTGGFGRAAEALRNENYRVESVVLASVGDVPEDAAAVVIAGPDHAFLDSEREALVRYLDRGGGLMVLLDPGAKTDLYDLLRSWGVEYGEDYIIDQQQGLFGAPASPMAASYAKHPITENLREVTLFHVARSVRPRTDTSGRFVEIVQTGENSWAETDLEGEPGFDERDVRGPIPLALAGTPQLTTEQKGAGEPPKARLVAFGDADFASNELIGAYRNRDLFVNSVNWLIGDVEAISIRPNLSRASRVQLSAAQYSRIRFLSLFVLPQTIAVLGAFAWWSRRRAPGR